MGHPFDNRQQCSRAFRAVDTQGRHPQRLRCQGKAFRRCSKIGAAAVLKRHCDENGKRRIFSDCQNRSAYLSQVGHGFNGGKISAGLHAGYGHFAEQIICFVKRQIAHGSHQCTNGADIQRYLRTSIGCTPGYPDGSANNLLYGMPGGRQVSPIGAKCIGTKKLRTCIYIGAMDLLHSVRIRETEKIRTFSGARPNCCSMVPIAPS